MRGFSATPTYEQWRQKCILQVLLPHVGLLQYGSESSRKPPQRGAYTDVMHKREMPC